MLNKRYWGRHFWARGYCCATVGQMAEEMGKNIWRITSSQIGPITFARSHNDGSLTRIRTFSP